MNRRDFADSAPMTAAFVAIGVGWGCFAALVPVLKTQIGASDSQFGLAMLISTVGAVIAMWNAPRAERWLGDHTMVYLTALMGIAFVLPSHATNMVQFAFFMMLVAMMTGTLDVVMNAKVSALETHSGRSLMGYNHGMFSIGYAASAFMTGLARAAGYTSQQIFLGVLVVLLLLLLAIYRPSPPISEENETPVPSKESGLSLAILLGGGVMLIAFMAEQATEGWSALHLERTLGAGAVGGAMGPTLLGATMALGRFAGQSMVRRAGPIGVTMIAAAISAAGSLMAALASSVGIAYAGFIVLGLGVSVIVPMTFVIVGRIVPVERRGQAIARVTALGYAGFFIGPPMMGFLSEWKGLGVSFAFIAISLMSIPAMLLVLSRRVR